MPPVPPVPPVSPVPTRAHTWLPQASLPLSLSIFHARSTKLLRPCLEWLSCRFKIDGEDGGGSHGGYGDHVDYPSPAGWGACCGGVRGVRGVKGLAHPPARGGHCARATCARAGADPGPGAVAGAGIGVRAGAGAGDRACDGASDVARVVASVVENGGSCQGERRYLAAAKSWPFANHTHLLCGEARRFNLCCCRAPFVTSGDLAANRE